MAAHGQANEESNFWKDPLRCLGFLPGACHRVNRHKKTFFETLVKKGLAHTFSKGYDFDPDSPILTNDQEDDRIQPQERLVFNPLTGKLTTVRTSTSSESFVSRLVANVFRPGAGVGGGFRFGPEGITERVLRKTKSIEMTKNRKTVLVIGAGISGLAAAYELKRAGHEVIILERQDRVGGRIKTLHFKPSGLRGEAGAMRIPMENRHYLTDAYIEKFHLKTKQFFNIDPEKNCFVSIRGETVRIHDFQSDEKEARNRAKEMCDKLWPGWDERIKGLRNEHDIYHIIDYYKLTVKEVIDSVPKWSGKEQDVDRYSQEWRDWMTRWSKMSFIDFLSSDAACSESCGTRFRPWPKIAIDCITDVNYIAHPGLSVATMLAEEVGQWWTPEMKTLTNGMEELPQAFINDDIAGENCLEKDVHYGITVRKVEWQNKQEKGNKEGYVKVTGRQTQTKNEVNFEADAVIITVPLNAMRQVVFNPALPQHVNDAIAGINYESSTKIFLGFRERFWEKTKFPVRNGGISKTDLPIGQIVYPSQPSLGEKSDRGVLLLYTWNKEALLFGSQSEDEAITEALRQVEMVYQGLLKDEKNASKVTDCFEVGAIQSWYTDPSAQGAFVHLLPYSYMNHLRYLLEPSIHPIYFGGEAISFANGWIQGALESGLRAAWQFYKFNEPCRKRSFQVPAPTLGPGPATPFSKYLFPI